MMLLRRLWHWMTEGKITDYSPVAMTPIPVWYSDYD